MAYYYPPTNYAGTATASNPAGSGSPGYYDVTAKPKGVAPSVFGGNPGTVNVPNIYGQLTDIIPQLPGMNAQIGQNVFAETQGQLSPEEIGNIQDYQARFGVESGMPGSELATNLGARTVGTSTRALQSQGLHDYTSLIPTIFKTQIVDPAQQIALSMWNATNEAKEDPFYGALFGALGNVAGGAGGGGGGM